MVKKMHLLEREHINHANRRIGIAVCGNWGRSLKNFTTDTTRVTCAFCKKRIPAFANSSDSISVR